MKLSKILIILTLLFVQAKAFSKDSIRIENFPKRIHLYTKIGPSYSHIRIGNKDLNNDLEFVPNVKSTMTLGFHYSWFGLAYSFNIPSDNESSLKYGKTKKHDFEAHYTMRRLMIDLTLKNYNGFYLSNPEAFDKSWDKNLNYPQVSDLRTRSVSASFAYIFRPDRFSSASAYTFSKAMRRSGGSWMVGGFASKNIIDSDSTIVPFSIKELVDPNFDIKKISISDIGISFGYSYLVTIRKKFFLCCTLLPGLSLQQVTPQSSIDKSTQKRTDLALRMVSHISLGYNGNRYFWGIKTYGESSSVTNHATELTFLSGHVAFFLGYRINTTNWKFMKKIDNILHPRPLRFITGNPPNRD
jgi:hypothetical protein